ncbi:MAG: ABC transporter substrate-binding protein [Chloroflexota bacterium]
MSHCAAQTRAAARQEWIHGLLSLALIFGLSLATPVIARAQAPLRFGVLVLEMGRGQSQAIKGFGEELNRLGYRERKDFFLEVRNVKGNRAALQGAARELVAQKVPLIFTTGTSATLAAMAATADIPVVFVHSGDPVATGLMKSTEERAKNLAGVAAYAAQTTERRLALLKAILPALQKIWVFFDANSAVSRKNFQWVENAAEKTGVQVVAFRIKSTDELKTTLASLRSDAGAAIFQSPDELVESEAGFLFETARAKKIPTMFNEESWAISGAMAAYGPNYLAMGRQAGRLSDKIHKGETPRSLPIERATKFDLTLNYRTASFIGVPLSKEMLKKAGKVIR